MTDLEEIFAELGISHYLNEFIEQGFDTWETILDITETDFDALGVKLGHRRKLQRKIANSRGLSSDIALISRNTPTDDRASEEQKSKVVLESKEGGVIPGAKRKYRRHPKPDENAPERPPSAYVIFSNKMREELKGRNLSFTEIAKLVGENWQNLSPTEKEPYELRASEAKERYNHELIEYKKTDSYRDYSLYLTEFKARQSNQQQASESEVAKRPKLEATISTGSIGSGSNSNAPFGESSSRCQSRMESCSSVSAAGPRMESCSSVPTAGPAGSPWLPPLPEAQLSPGNPMPKLTMALGPPPKALGQVSPTSESPPVLRGYRDSLFATGHKILPWRDGQRDEMPNHVQQLPKITSVSDRRLSFPDPKHIQGALQQSHNRTVPGHRPPLMKSESNTHSKSSSSTPPAYFTSRAPVGSPLDRPLSIPLHCNQKTMDNFERQLPPLIRPSHSPPVHRFGVQQPSPKGNLTDFSPGHMPPMRSFGGDQRDPRTREHLAVSAAEEHNLDPVSALLKADEIVNRNTRGKR